MADKGATVNQFAEIRADIDRLRVRIEDALAALGRLDAAAARGRRPGGGKRTADRLAVAAAIADRGPLSFGEVCSSFDLCYAAAAQVLVRHSWFEKGPGVRGRWNLTAAGRDALAAHRAGQPVDAPRPPAGVRGRLPGLLAAGPRAFADLARDAGVTRHTLRAALRRLRDDGAVRQVPRKGWELTPEGRKLVAAPAGGQRE